MPYCSFATSGLSARKLNILRLMVKGIGTMSAMNSTISATSRTKTWMIDVLACGQMGDIDDRQHRRVDQIHLEYWDGCLQANEGGLRRRCRRRKEQTHERVVERHNGGPLWKVCQAGKSIRSSEDVSCFVGSSWRGQIGRQRQDVSKCCCIATKKKVDGVMVRRNRRRSVVHAAANERHELKPCVSRATASSHFPVGAFQPTLSRLCHFATWLD
jgi:hypothetical protein